MASTRRDLFKLSLLSALGAAVIPLAARGEKLGEARALLRVTNSSGASKDILLVAEGRRKRFRAYDVVWPFGPNSPKYDISQIPRAKWADPGRYTVNVPGGPPLQVEKNGWIKNDVGDLVATTWCEVGAKKGPVTGSGGQH